MNTGLLVGRLAADPDAGKGPTPMARFRLAVDAWDSSTKTKGVDFIPLVAFGKTAETVLKYCTKGKYVAVRYKVKPRKWETPGGETRYENSLVVDELDLGPGGGTASHTPAAGAVDEEPGDPFSFS